MTRFLVHLKQTLRRSTFIQRILFYVRKIFFFFLGYTPLKAVADVYLGVPMKDFIFFPDKVFLFNKVRPYTMALYHHVDNAYTIARLIKRKNIAGSFVECGGGQSGVVAVMALVDSDRKTWYFNFSEDVPQLEFASHDDIVGALGLSRSSNIVVGGNAEGALRRYKKEVGPIAVLRLNSSSYGRTMEALEQLYDSVVRDGFIIASDYGGVLGQKEAVVLFFEKKKDEIHCRTCVDGEAVFQKMYQVEQGGIITPDH